MVEEEAIQGRSENLPMIPVPGLAVAATAVLGVMTLLEISSIDDLKEVSSLSDTDVPEGTQERIFEILEEFLV